MMDKRKKQKTREENKTTLTALKEKHGRLILLREDLEAQENFAIDFAEKKEIIQGLINVNHQIQALKVVIDLFSESE